MMTEEEKSNESFENSAVRSKNLKKSSVVPKLDMNKVFEVQAIQLKAAEEYEYQQKYQ